MNTHTLKLFAVLSCGFAAAVLSAQTPKLQFPQASPSCTLKQRVGLTDIEITYSRPGTKGRTIFGEKGLVPFGEVWRTGANTATKLTVSTPIKLGGSDVPAGSYAVFSIPDAKEWTVILNRVTGQWGAYKYDEKNDVVRVKAPAQKLTEPVETFTIDVNDIRDDSATLNLVWEKTRVPVKVQVDVIPAVVQQIEAATASGRKLSAGEYAGAAMFNVEHGRDLKQALGWIDAAIAEQPKGFYLYYQKARILAKQGDVAGARAAAQKSIDVARSQGGPVGDEYIRLNNDLLSKLGK